MLTPINEESSILSIYLQISQYPILAPHIRERMREEFFRRGIITPERLEEEAKEKAVLSQQREGLNIPSARKKKSSGCSASAPCATI